MNTFGPGLLGDIRAASSHEWLVTDGRGGYAMGTIGGLRTRRYHGLLVVPVDGASRRCMALVALDPVLIDGDERTRLATDEWSSGVIDPAGNELLTSFDLDDGVPRWRWQIGDIVIERELAMMRNSSTVGVVHRVVSTTRPVSLELTALCTWRDAHGDRPAGVEPQVVHGSEGFVFEGHYRVNGPGWSPGGSWYRGVYAREESARGLPGGEGVWAAGTFSAHFDPLLDRDGTELEIVATADLDRGPTSAVEIVSTARLRADALLEKAEVEEADRESTVARLVLAADQFVIASSTGSTVDAGYPWFGEWSRDAMVSYEGLFLATNRPKKGLSLLRRAAASISQGMLRNTTDVATDPSTDDAFNTIDAALWFVHAVGRHIERKGDRALAAEFLPAVTAVVDGYLDGTRFAIGVDADGLVRGGADGIALTWMDARVDGRPVTQRAGKPVEIQALWIAALRTASMLADRSRNKKPRAVEVLPVALASFHERFTRRDGLGLYDVVDGPTGDDASIRPNQLFAVALPRGPFDPPDGPLRGELRTVARAVVDVCGRRLLTPLGLRTLDPADPAYRGRHRGSPAERDAAYHQGTVWPWLLGPWCDAVARVGGTPPHLDVIEAHLDEFGIGSVSETADGDAPHACAGAPFQAWSVAEPLRVLLAGTATTRSGASRPSPPDRSRRA